MTKKEYFLFLWLLNSLSSIFFVIYALLENTIAHDSPSTVIILQHRAINVLLSIGINGVMLAIGLYCAQKIGARLLLLNENYDFKKDILKPALIGAVIYSMVAFALSVLIMKDPRSPISSFDLSYYRLNTFFAAVKFDLLTLLFFISGIAFIIKKLAKNLSMSIVMPLSIGVVMIVVHGPWWPMLLQRRLFITTDTFFTAMVVLALGMFFWKKGLETALLFHTVVVALLYWIIPFAVSVITT